MENNLEIDVKNATERGLSYGQYKALRFDPNAAPVKKKVETGITCPVCGGIVTPPRFRVCSDECAEIRKRQRRKAREAREGRQC